MQVRVLLAVHGRLQESLGGDGAVPVQLVRGRGRIEPSQGERGAGEAEARVNDSQARPLQDQVHRTLQGYRVRLKEKGRNSESSQ